MPWHWFVKGPRYVGFVSPTLVACAQGYTKGINEAEWLEHPGRSFVYPDMGLCRELVAVTRPESIVSSAESHEHRGDSHADVKLMTTHAEGT